MGVQHNVIVVPHMLHIAACNPEYERPTLVLQKRMISQTDQTVLGNNSVDDNAGVIHNQIADFPRNPDERFGTLVRSSGLFRRDSSKPKYRCPARKCNLL